MILDHFISLKDDILLTMEMTAERKKGQVCILAMRKTIKAGFVLL